MTLKGKCAVITGSNSGIGLGVAREMARAGADVVLNSFTDREEDHALAAEIAKEFDVDARYIQADMSKGDQCRDLITKAGRCDILVNNAALAGHVHVGDWAILGGYTLVHQFCKIGDHCFTGMGSAIGKDVPAYVMVNGNPASAKSINSEGLRRRGFTKEEVSVINKCFKLVYRRGLTVDEALQELEQLAGNCEPVTLMIDSLKNSSRGIVR